MKKIIDFCAHFYSILGALGRLGATLGSQKLRCAFQASIFKDFVSNWGPQLAKRRPSGASGGGLFWGLFFGPTFASNLGPKGEGAYPSPEPLLPPLIAL